MTKKNETLRKLVYAAVCLALAMVLPFITGQIPEIGNMLSPMHIPVLLCGFLCGWPWGLAVGFIAPLLRSVTLGAPPMMLAIPMAFELAAYGAMTGLLYRLLPKKPVYVYVALIGAMLVGRAVWGLARFVMAGLQATSFPFSAFLAGAFLNAVPGIILQILLIPPVVLAMRRAKLSCNG